MTHIKSACRALIVLLFLAASFPMQARPTACMDANVRVRSGESDISGRWMTFEMGEYVLRDQRIKGQLFSSLHCEMNPNPEMAAKAGLPVFAAELPVSPGKKVRVIIEDRLCEEVQLDYPLLVSKKSPGTKALVETGELCISEEGNVQKVYFHPVHYNAKNKTLRITKSMTLRVEEVQAPSALSAKQSPKSLLPS